MRLDRDGILLVSTLDVQTGSAAGKTIRHTHQQIADDTADRAVMAIAVD
jgi:hypothetical protein